jgi:DNA-binding MarR family transcriptional regulator
MYGQNAPVGGRGSEDGSGLDRAGFDRLVLDRIAQLEPDADRDAMAVVFNLIRLANVVVADVETSVHRPRGLSWAGFRILFALWIAGPIEPRALARLAAVTRASISSVLNTLERRELVERRRESADRRVVTVLLTAKGRRAVASAFRAHHARERAWLAALSPAEVDNLAALLHRLLATQPAAPEPTG